MTTFDVTADDWAMWEPYEHGGEAVSFDSGRTWQPAGYAHILRGLRLLSGLVGHVPTVTITAVDRESGTITVA